MLTDYNDDDHIAAMLDTVAAAAATEVRYCTTCFATETPQWRRQTSGGTILLCNGCGMKASRKNHRSNARGQIVTI